MMNVLLVGMGGMLGSITRYILAQSLASSLIFPTALINLSGSFIMGSILGMTRERWGEGWFLFMTTGVLGGFTTYSAFAGESLTLLKQGLYLSALGYTSLTLIGGLVMVGLGFYLAQLLAA